MPADAIVTAEQAESALGHVQATDFDADIFESLDDDQKEEEMALIGRKVNPPLLTYDCISWSPFSHSDSAKTMGWHAGLSLRHLNAVDFACTSLLVRTTLEESMVALHQQFVEEMHAPDAVAKLDKTIASLDPTQREAYKSIAEWAQLRHQWEIEPDSNLPPGLEFLLLGTAGTGKHTHGESRDHKSATLVSRFQCGTDFSFLRRCGGKSRFWISYNRQRLPYEYR